MSRRWRNQGEDYQRWARVQHSKLFGALATAWHRAPNICHCCAFPRFLKGNTSSMDSDYKLRKSGETSELPEMKLFSYLQSSYSFQIAPS